MRDEDFKAKLSEVAEWRIPTSQSDAELLPRPNANYLKGQRPPKGVKQLLEQDDSDDNEQPLDIQDQNFPPMLLKVKNACTCEDCGQHCADGRTVDIRRHEHRGKKCWRKRCTACEQWQDPYTGEWDQTGVDNMQQWNKFLRGEAKEERLIKKAAMEKVIAAKIGGRNVDIIESEEGIIVKYRD